MDVAVGAGLGNTLALTKVVRQSPSYAQGQGLTQGCLLCKIAPPAAWRPLLTCGRLVLLGPDRCLPAGPLRALDQPRDALAILHCPEVMLTYGALQSVSLCCDPAAL